MIYQLMEDELRDEKEKFNEVKEYIKLQIDSCNRSKLLEEDSYKRGRIDGLTSLLEFIEAKEEEYDRKKKEREEMLFG